MRFSFGNDEARPRTGSGWLCGPAGCCYLASVATSSRTTKVMPASMTHDKNGPGAVPVHGTSSRRAPRSRLRSRGAAARRQESGRRRRPRLRRRAPRRVATGQSRLRDGHPAAPQRDVGGGARDDHRHPVPRRTGRQQGARPRHAPLSRPAPPPLDLPPLWQTRSHDRVLALAGVQARSR